MSQTNIKIQCFFSSYWFRLDRGVGSNIRYQWKKKRKFETVKLVSFEIHCDCITIVFAVTKNRLLCVRIEITYFVVFFPILCEIRLCSLWSLYFYRRSTCDFINWLQHVFKGRLSFYNFFPFIWAQPSIQFILNSINKLCDS